jgi:hypothetical protein
MFKNIKNINRISEILSVFLKNEVGFVISKTGLLRFMSLLNRIRIRLKKQESGFPARLRKSVWQLSPVFIRFLKT